MYIFVHRRYTLVNQTKKTLSIEVTPWSINEGTPWYSNEGTYTLIHKKRVLHSPERNPSFIVGNYPGPDGLRRTEVHDTPHVARVDHRCAVTRGAAVSCLDSSAACRRVAHGAVTDRRVSKYSVFFPPAPVKTGNHAHNAEKVLQQKTNKYSSYPTIWRFWEDILCTTRYY